MGYFLDGLAQSFRHQRRPVDDCSPERGGMAQNGRTRGGTFHGEMDRCRESQGWSTACIRMPERDGKDQEEDSPKQTGSCWFARPCRLATSGANLYPPGVWFADDMTSFSGVTFVFVLLRFRLYAFVEGATLRSIVLRYAGVSIATRVFFLFSFSFCLFGDVAFSEYFFVSFVLSLCMESTSCVLSFRMVFFYLVTT